MTTHDQGRTSAGVTCAAALAIAALCWPGTAVAQEPDAPTFEERMEVTEVLLDVVVTDRKGNPVAGLDTTDFVVEENGREIRLSGADFYSTRYEAEPSGADLDVIPASRYFIFFFDDARMSSNRFNQLTRQQFEAAKDSRRWIEEEMQPSDWIAIAGYGRKLKIFHDFTQERSALLQAVTEAARGSDPEKGHWTQEPPSASAASLLRQLPTGRELRRQTRHIHAGLSLLAEATGHIVGRKTLLYFGIGFGVLDGFDGSAVPDRRYYARLERALNDNNVAVYPIDLTRQGTRHSQSSFLNTFAFDTGGVYYQNFASFLGPLRAIANANVGYYLLSYQSEHPHGESGYQKLTVQMRTSSLVVRAQRGYRYGDKE